MCNECMVLCLCDNLLGWLLTIKLDDVVTLTVCNLQSMSSKNNESLLTAFSKIVLEVWLMIVQMYGIKVSVPIKIFAKPWKMS